MAQGKNGRRAWILGLLLPQPSLLDGNILKSFFYMELLGLPSLSGVSVKRIFYLPFKKGEFRSNLSLILLAVRVDTGFCLIQAIQVTQANGRQELRHHLEPMAPSSVTLWETPSLLHYSSSSAFFTQLSA